jgi:outer membrane immunogenic protein
MLKGIAGISAFASVAAAMATGAVAADMPVKAPVAAVYGPAFSWTGFYIGVSGGFAWGRTGAVAPPPPPPPAVAADPEPKGDGAAIGGLIAYYYQMPNNIVFGVVADGHWANIEGEHRSVTGNFYRAETEAFGSVRGVAGVAFGRVLVSATGGLGWARNTVAVGSTFASSHDQQTHFGYAVGGSVDVAMSDRFVVSGQVLRYDVGHEDYVLYGTARDVRSRFTTVQGTLKYRFGGAQ